MHTSCTIYRCKQEGQGTLSLPAGIHKGASPGEAPTSTRDASRVILGMTGGVCGHLCFPRAGLGQGAGLKQPLVDEGCPAALGVRDRGRHRWIQRAQDRVLRVPQGAGDRSTRTLLSKAGPAQAHRDVALPRVPLLSGDGQRWHEAHPMQVGKIKCNAEISISFQTSQECWAMTCRGLSQGSWETGKEEAGA